MRDALILSRAGVSDWPAIWPIWRQIVHAGDTYCYDPDTDFDTARSMWLPDGTGRAPPDELWQARAGVDVVGCYHLSRNQAGPGQHVANASYMVAARARGAGVGRVMVEHSVAHAAELGFRAVQFNAVAATNLPAIGLYERLGFSIVGRVPGAFRHPTTGYVDLLVMHRSL